MSSSAARAFEPSAPFPTRWPRRYRALAEGLGPGNPLLRLSDPDAAEGLPDPDALPDATGDRRLRPLPFLVRKHRDRVVVLASGRCFSHCRFCFRREEVGSGARPGPHHWERIARWLAAHPEVEEVILSGGDPLALPDRRLREIAKRLAAVPSLRRWRIHTRAPVVLPDRVTRGLLRALDGPLPLRLVIHAAHPAEIDSRVEAAVGSFRAAGAEVLSQSVLLAGVTDEPGVLAGLWTRVSEAGAVPKYLHHPDRAPGNAAFRVPLRRGLALHREAADRLGPAKGAPPYVVDLPNGAGKAEVRDLEAGPVERRPGTSRTRWRWNRPAGWDALVADEAFEWWDVWETAAP